MVIAVIYHPEKGWTHALDAAAAQRRRLRYT
jgi:hypothetical protein